MITGNVFSIEEFSTFNGPGIRTTVFLKGCPLRCEWCHSPEGQEFQNSILRSPNGCAGCGNCIKYAEKKDGKMVFTEESISHCPNNLLRWCATVYTPESLTERLKKNAAILNESGGGVTFSGGEPLAQPVFLTECLQRLRGVTDRALQTGGYADGEVFAKVLQETDRVLFDIKLIEDEQHIRYTKCSNRPILSNFDRLVQSGVAFTVRIPLIPGVTDTAENITGICRFLKERGVSYAEVLPYNKMAGSKYALAGQQYAPSFDEAVPSDPHKEIFDAFQIQYQMI